jgi:membrane-bound ClpP family serine protease
MLDRDLVLYHAQLKGSGAPDVVSEKEYKADKDHVKWSAGAARLVKKEGEYLKLDAALAKELGIVEYNDVKDLEDLYGRPRFDISSAGVKVFRDDWLDEIAEFFRGPLVKMVLVMLGIIGLIIELKMPGTAIGGIVAGICFVLFFWAHSFIGEYTMLAVLLFVLGLILIGLEIFVFPGFGLPGISGILLIVVSLAIVTLEKMPSTTSDWLQLAWTLGTFAISLVVAIAAAFMLAWYLPHIPYANRLVLVPPSEPTFGEGQAENPLASLLGAIGVAETPLRPAGKVRFGEDYHDVIAEGDFVNPGSRVQVIEIEGQRIVVKQV